MAQTATASHARSFSGAQAVTSPWLLTVYLITILTPLYISLGPIRFDPPRLFLLVMFVPFLAGLFSGRAGRLVLPDILMMCFSAWIVITLVYHHGAQGIETGGITVVELLGGWMAGRILIRNTQDYRRFVTFMVTALVLLLPFVLISLTTGRNILLEFFHAVGSAPPIFYMTRWEVIRTQLVFGHPILMGLFCSLVIANVFYLFRRWFLLTAFGVGMTFSSLSAGPLLAVAFQGGMIGWNLIFPNRWKLLAILSVIGYVVIDALSNRTPIVILIETLTFSAGTGWTRIHIWNFGSAAVMNNPIFGIGFNTYPKPTWLTDSVDNFWLLNALRHGLVGAGFLIVALGIHIAKILRAKSLSAEQRKVRTAYMVTLVGTIMTLSTVHVWGGISTLIMFLAGAGSFLYTAPPQADGEDSPEPEASGHVPRSAHRRNTGNARFSRFSSRSDIARTADDAADRSTRNGGRTTSSDRPPRYSRQSGRETPPDPGGKRSDKAR